MLSATDRHAMTLAIRTDAGRGNAARRRLADTVARRLTVCAMLLALATPAWADVSRDQAAAAAQRQTGGRVLSVEKTESGRRPVWRVKVVTPRGEVRVVFIDAESGRGG